MKSSWIIPYFLHIINRQNEIKMKRLVHFYFIFISYNLSMSNRQINIQITLTLLLLALTLIYFQFSNADIFMQDFLFDANSKTWLIDKHDKIYSFIFYSGAKKLLITFGIFVLLALTLLRKSKWVKLHKKGLLILLLCLIITPLVVGTLKATTNIPCPKNIEYYGGIYPDVKVFDKYPFTFNQSRKAKCFPAGHASGGFALLGLVFVFKKKEKLHTCFYNCSKCRLEYGRL